MTLPISVGPFNGQRRATKVEARLDSTTTQGGQDPDCDPPAWNPNAYTRFKKIIIARSHLLAKSLGGPGTCDNLVTACQTVNQKMYNDAESIVLAQVNKGRVVDYRVVANYDSLQDAVPSSITVEAKWMNPDGTCGMVGPISFSNQINLQRC